MTYGIKIDKAFKKNRMIWIEAVFIYMRSDWHFNNDDIKVSDKLWKSNKMYLFFILSNLNIVQLNEQIKTGKKTAKNHWWHS